MRKKTMVEKRTIIKRMISQSRPSVVVLLWFTYSWCALRACNCCCMPLPVYIFLQFVAMYLAPVLRCT
jgi:hypothetical protein